MDHDTVFSPTCRDGVTEWVEQDCAPGAGCVAGACVVGACSDECRLGQPGCVVFDPVTGETRPLNPETSGLDRSRAYRKWLHRDGMPHGGVGNALYDDPPAYTQINRWRGLWDSAIWTGTYLAGESWRLQATGSVEARDSVRALVETLHRWWNVAGHPGMLARYAAPSDHPATPVLEQLDCELPGSHCGVEYDGETWDYMGHISRDQYQGVMLGYAAAYQALPAADEDLRALIRDDVVEFVRELMKERTLPLRVVVDGVPVDVDATIRFVVTHPGEYVDGRAFIDVASGNLDGEMWGFQEFLPNAGDLAKQIPGFGLFGNVPRADSAIMLASFFRVAMAVTGDVPGFEADHAAFRDFYYGNEGQGGNVYDWLPIATQWAYGGTCGKSYYATNIAMEPMFNLLELEDDAAVRDSLVHNTLEGALWTELQGTKNPWFSFMRSAQLGGPDEADVAQAVDQLLQFPPPPRVRHGVDLLAEPAYQPHNPDCPGQTTTDKAVDVAQRVVSDFIWQRHPWGLEDGGDDRVTYPGVDYLAAYWLGRDRGFIEPDDGSCLVWSP